MIQIAQDARNLFKPSYNVERNGMYTLPTPERREYVSENTFHYTHYKCEHDFLIGIHLM